MAEVEVAPIVNEGSPMMLIGIEKVIQVIGFESEVERAGIMQAGLGRFEDFRYLVVKDIRDMVDEFGKRTQANGWIVFGLGCTKKMTAGILQWVQDFHRASNIPNHENSDEETMYAALSLPQILKSDI